MDNQNIVMLQTNLGVIYGISDGQISTFLGVPYGRAKRWEYPTLIDHFDVPIIADKHPPLCYQPTQGAEGRLVFSEDCLYLNIFAPAKAADAPVIVFFHGGNFIYGGLSCQNVQLQKWAEQGVIAVAVGYRLGAFGFAAIPELADPNGRLGNYGLYDMLAALQWINNHIHSFGGNPNGITLVGHSAGAIAAQYLCLSKYANKLFNKAVLISGGGYTAMRHFLISIEDAFPFWREVQKACGSGSVEEFRKVSPVVLERAFEYVRKKYPMKRNAAWYHPVIDGNLVLSITADQYYFSLMALHGVIFGCTEEDIIPDLFREDLYSCVKHLPSAYCYMFCEKSGKEKRHAIHDSDLPYWIGTIINNSNYSDDAQLSNKMISYLCNFVKTGNPNSLGQQTWTSGKLLHICWRRV